MMRPDRHCHRFAEKCLFVLIGPIPLHYREPLELEDALPEKIKVAFQFGSARKEWLLQPCILENAYESACRGSAGPLGAGRLRGDDADGIVIPIPSAA
jgi:hypothetical protein